MDVVVATDFVGAIEAQTTQLSSHAVREISAYTEKCNCCALANKLSDSMDACEPTD